MTQRTVRTQKKRGAVAVEFALVAPIFLAMILGMLEFSNALMVQQAVTNAAREGARRAIIPGATDEQVYDIMDTYMESAGVTGQTRVITPSLTTAESGDELNVTIVVPFSAVSWGLLDWLENANLSANVRMRKE